MLIVLKTGIYLIITGYVIIICLAVGLSLYCVFRKEEGNNEN